jgi:hypothetical protein
MITDAKQDLRPGLHPRRLGLLMRQAIERCALDLSGRVVLTEAASGAYVVTPVLAAMAGARRVYAVTRSTAFGTAEDVVAQTLELANVVGVAQRLEITTRKSREHVAEADIVTNSGHVRPLDAETIAWMKPEAVIPLMYESWEYRPGDVDLDACRRQGILVAGTNEQHPAVEVFPYLGIMAVKLLLDAGVAVRGSRVLVLCDNPFGPSLVGGLLATGASVDLVADPADAGDVPYDAVIVAMTPQARPFVGGDDAVMTAREVTRRWPGAILAQFWGDIDRDALAAEQVPYWPVPPVARGHMGILPSAVGPEPIVRLQCGGLKVGEILARGAGVTDPYYAVAQLIRV